MKMFIKLFFSAEGPNPLEILRKIQGLGFQPVFGQYDLVREVKDIDEYIHVVEELHNSLRGTKVFYNLYSTKE
ncbi:MAG: hypothetical protein GXO25_04890 [Euryarchaeota archaeon]|nr:hypothetical protein [Euryarchaeota archaeon]